MFLLSTNVNQEEHAQENDFLQWLGIFHRDSSINDIG